jgi:hypothetical protein
VLADFVSKLRVAFYGCGVRHKRIVP